MQLHQLDTRRERSLDTDKRLLQRMAQRNDVAALGHRHAECNHLFALVVHFHGRRIHIAFADRGNVFEAELVAARAANRHVCQLLHCIELATHPHLHDVQGGLHRTCRLHRVLLAELGQHLVEVQAQLGQALLRDLDVQLFVLRAEQLHFGHVRHPQQALAHIVRKRFEFRVVKAFAFQRVDHAIHIAEVVVKEWAHHALGQRATHVADLFAHAVPDVGHLAALAGVFDLENDLGLAGLGVAADFVGVLHLLQGALQLVGDLLGHLLGRRPRPIGADHHGAEGKGRVFILPELKVGSSPQEHEHDHQVAGQRRMLQRPFGEVKPLARFLHHGRLTWPQLHWRLQQRALQNP